MKIIKINESQKNRLFEAYQDGFSLETLSMIGDSGFADEDNSVPQMAYCTKWLGYPDSLGSSRAVYTLTDNFVLKLAYGHMYLGGREQNRVESEVFKAINSPLLPRIMYCDDNYTFLVVENVIPAKYVDFEKILGMPYFGTYTQQSLRLDDPDSKFGGDYEIGYDKYFDDLKSRDEGDWEINALRIITHIEWVYSMGRGYSNDPSIVRWQKIVENIIANNEWFSELKELVQKTKMTDLTRIENFGIVNRNGKPLIVVIDSGLNKDVYKKFYEPR